MSSISIANCPTKGLCLHSSYQCVFLHTFTDNISQSVKLFHICFISTSLIIIRWYNTYYNKLYSSYVVFALSLFSPFVLVLIWFLYILCIYTVVFVINIQFTFLLFHVVNSTSSFFYDSVSSCILRSGNYWFIFSSLWITWN